MKQVFLAVILALSFTALDPPMVSGVVLPLEGECTRAGEACNGIDASGSRISGTCQLEPGADTFGCEPRPEGSCTTAGGNAGSYSVNATTNQYECISYFAPLPGTPAPTPKLQQLSVDIPCQAMGGECPGDTLSVTGYLGRLYQFALAAGVALAVGSIVFGGLLYTWSAANPSKQSEAKDRIIKAVLGLALLLGAVFILNTINPRLANPILGALEPQKPLEPGLFDKIIADTRLNPSCPQGFIVFHFKCLVTSAKKVCKNNPQFGSDCFLKVLRAFFSRTS